MKLKGSIQIVTPMNSREPTVLVQVEDGSSHVRFLEIEVPLESWARCLMQSMSVDCELSIRGLDKLGTTREHRRSLVITGGAFNNLSHRAEDYRKILKKTADDLCASQGLMTDGWRVSHYDDFTNHHRVVEQNPRTVSVGMERYVPTPT